MMDEKIERDPELSALLSGVSGEAPVDQVDWDAMRRRVQAGTASVIHAKRTGRRWVRAFMGTAMAASVTLLFMVSRWNEVGSGSGAFAGNDATIEEILGSDASDEELRALLAGAGGVDELLLLAAADGE